MAGQTNRWIIAILLVTAVALTGCGVGPAVESDWRNASGEPIDRGLLWSYQGPSEHCDWASAAFLAIGRTGDVAGVPADMNDQYVRDPDHLFVSELATGPSRRCVGHRSGHRIPHREDVHRFGSSPLCH